MMKSHQIVAYERIEMEISWWKISIL